jgi:glycine cleavage system H protein
MTSSKKIYHVVPPGELGCVWMNAGIVSYRLCDRMYDCDSCPLDAAMRKHMVPQAVEQGADAISSSPSPSPEGLRSGLRYSPNHCWSREITPHLVRIGMEPSLSAALLAPRAIVYPNEGQSLKRGQTCLWIVTEGGTLPVESPLDGVLRRTNSLLLEAPHLLNEDPFERGWLFDLEIDPAETRAANLMSADQAAPKFSEDESRLMDLIARALQGNRPQVGVTLADGGQRLQNIADILGPAKYFNLLRQIYW